MKYFREREVTHIHSHWATLPTTCALFISLVTKIPFSFSAHAWDIFVSGTEYLLKEKIERADRVFTCTQFNKDRLSEFGDADKIEVLYHGIEIDRYPFEAKAPPDSPLILAGGSLIPQKGLSDLVEALAIVRENDVSFRAGIFGDGPERRILESLIDEHRLGDVVELTGTLPHDDVIGLMQRASVFVMPSKLAAHGYTDGLPNVVAEAMACGVCVVATRYSGIPELVEDGADGLLVEPGDVAGLATSIERVLKDIGLWQALCVHARTKVESVFDVRQNVKPLADYFERLPAEGERPSLTRT
jgi:glycosyltransferase involved in cell wall biosynthesis